jgi:hypothetical protein
MSALQPTLVRPLVILFGDRCVGGAIFTVLMSRPEHQAYTAVLSPYPVYHMLSRLCACNSRMTLCEVHQCWCAQCC